MVEEKRNVEELIRQIAGNTEKTRQYAKRQYRVTMIAAISCLLMLGVILAAYVTLVPSAGAALDSIETASKDLGAVSRQLAEADLDELVVHVVEMAVTSEEGIQAALEKIESIDIDELNRAIKALSDVVTPLARLVNRFQ